jgi:hypothetical protein
VFWISVAAETVFPGALDVPAKFPGFLCRAIRRCAMDCRIARLNSLHSRIDPGLSRLLSLPSGVLANGQRAAPFSLYAQTYISSHYLPMKRPKYLYITAYLRVGLR